MPAFARVIDPQRVGAIRPTDPAIPARAESSHFLLQSWDHAGVEAIVVLGPIGAYTHPAKSPEYSEVVLHGGPAYAELSRHYRADFAGGVFPAREHLDDPSPNRLPQHLEDVHDFTLSVRDDVNAN